MADNSNMQQTTNTSQATSAMGTNVHRDPLFLIVEEKFTRDAVPALVENEEWRRRSRNLNWQESAQP